MKKEPVESAAVAASREPGSSMAEHPYGSLEWRLILVREDRLYLHRKKGRYGS